MHQVILPGAHTSLTWVSIPILTVVAPSSTSLVTSLQPFWRAIAPPCLWQQSPCIWILQPGILQSLPIGQLLSLAPCLGVVRGTPTSSSPLQSSTFRSLSQLWPLHFSWLSELHTLYNGPPLSLANEERTVCQNREKQTQFLLFFPFHFYFYFLFNLFLSSSIFRTQSQN